MPTSLDKFPVNELLNDLVDGTLIPFLGSGAHVGAGAAALAPDGPGLAALLRKAMGAAYIGREQEALAMVAQVYETVIFSRSKLYSFLHQKLHVDVDGAALPILLNLLVRLPPAAGYRFVVTTNYDSYIERAYSEAGRSLCVVRQNMRNAEAGPRQLAISFPNGNRSFEDAVNWSWSDDRRVPVGTTILYKIHGSVDQTSPAEDDLIITEDDYIEFLVNAGGSTAAFFPPSSLGSAFSRRSFFFLGYSLSDWNMRAFLRVLELRASYDSRHYALRREPSELESRLWEHRNVELLTGTLEELCNLAQEFLSERQQID